MAKAHVFEVKEKYAKGYEFAPGRRPSATRNPAGVTAIMGLSNGRGASNFRAPRRTKRQQRAFDDKPISCRDKRGKFATCEKRRRKRAADRAATRAHNAQEKKATRRAAAIRGKRGGATCWSKPRKKYIALGATKRSDYAYPECWAYPVGSRKSKWAKILPARAAKWFDVHEGKYEPSVRRQIKSRIEKALERQGESRRSRKHSARSRRNPSEFSPQGATEMEEEYGFEFEDFEPNRGRRRKGKKAKRRVRKSRWARKSRSVSKRRRHGRRWASKRRSTSRRSASRGKWARRASKARRKHTRRSHARRRSYARRSTFRSLTRKRRAGKSRRRYRSNAIAGTPEMRAYMAARRAARPELKGLSASKQQKRIAELRAEHLRDILKGQHRLGAERLRFRSPWPWGSPFYAPWDRPKAPKDKKPKYPPGTRELLFRGYKPHDLFAAMQDLTQEQIRAMFPTYGAYKKFMRQAMRDRRFRRYRGKFARGTTFYKAKRRSRLLRKLRSLSGKGKWARRSANWGRKGKWARRSANWGRKGKWARRRARLLKKYRRNELGGALMVPNMPFISTGELFASGLCAVAGYAVPQVVAGLLGKINPYAGIIGGLVAGVAAVYGSDKIFDNEAYAKGTAIGGILGLLVSSYKIVKGYMSPAGVALSGIQSVPTTRYRPMGQFQQAQAGYGQFQQAQAGYGQFQQAQAGFGEYVQGTGEYVTQDQSLMPVSDFGEYVSSGINVEGYSDYEVLPSYSPSVDGFGYVNEGVHPGSNMDHEFNIMEAAAGLGQAQPQNVPNYIPTVQSGQVASHGSSPDAGIFDIGGPNGVFG